MDEIKRRTGGVTDVLKPRAQRTIKAFAKKHNFPDANIMEERLLKARMSALIYRDIAPPYRKKDVFAHPTKLKNGLSKLLSNLELEPFFSDLALSHSGIPKEQLIDQLRNTLHSIDAIELSIQDDSISLQNSIDGAGRPNAVENQYLYELKCIHKLSRSKSWVTYDPYADDPKKAFKGAFFEFVKDCYKLDNYKISDGALAKRIVSIRKLIEKNNTQNP